MAQVLRYELDNLGASLFESLVQSLLHSELGLSIECWGGIGDYGRDAYSRGPLNYPSKHSLQAGPFLFQAKFVAGANAANARPGPLLRTAVQKEMAQIEDRRKNGSWQDPRFYILITNVPLTSKLRNDLTKQISKFLPKSEIQIQGAADVAAMLEHNEAVARSFPFVVNANAIKWTVLQAVHNGVIQRSDGAKKSVEELFQVFVRTVAYDEAWKKLREHKFVVLEGPPEVGKTAIGWMIASYLSAKAWNVIDCSDPHDFFHLYENDLKQVFIADDAFGRTEYKVTLGDEWASNLHKILAKLDGNHILIWTTRAHILQTALREMSLQGLATRFPKPSDVLVDASRISRIERAFMLYRHARAAGLEEFARSIIRENAEHIIDNPHFTPLRIARFVSSRLPELAPQLEAQNSNKELIRRSIDAELRNPTDALRKAFNKLTNEQKRVLLAVLDSGQRIILSEIGNRLDALGGNSADIEDQLKVLDQAFLRIEGFYVKWIHPSNRDLVIEQLEKDSTLSADFLEKCSFEGLSLAISHTGGAKGKRAFPLMHSDKSWQLLEQRLMAEITSAQEIRASEILRILKSAIDAATGDSGTAKKLISISTAVLNALRQQIDSGIISSPPYLLEEYVSLSTSIKLRSLFPDISRRWLQCQKDFFDTVQEANNGMTSLDSSSILEFARYANVLSKAVPSFFDLEMIRQKFASTVHGLVLQVRAESNDAPLDSDPEILEAEAERFAELERSLEHLKLLFPELTTVLEDAAGDAGNQAHYLRDKSSESRENYEEWEEEQFSDRSYRSSFTIGIADIFRDL